VRGRAQKGEIEAVYAEFDEGLGGLGARCGACGRCCTFPPENPVLYATALERAYLAEKPPPRREGLPARACPYLDARSGRCTARDRRPVGCRTYFCEGALPDARAREAARELGERALAGLRRIVARRGLDWDYAPAVERLRSG
jgi:hypothetical protein